MPADNDLDPLDRWLSQPVWPMSPPDGAFDRITKRARRRRVRKTVTAAASAAAVAAAIAVAVPLGLSAGLASSTSSSDAAAGVSRTAGSGLHSVQGTGTKAPTASPTVTQAPSSASSAASGAGTSPGPTGIASPGYLPANFVPSSVTWVSASTGYVIGQAGTPGTCGAQGNSDICTSLAVTHDTGQTWSGLAAPSTGAASGVTGVSGVRFLNDDDGWAYGPELWYTTNGSASIPAWTKVNTGGQIVTALETADDQAFAIFATCPADVTQAEIAYQCTSFTLKTSVPGSSVWKNVSGVPAGLTPNAVYRGGAELVLANSAAGFFVSPQNVLYSGPLNGGAWHEVGALPCSASAAYLNNGIAHPLLLATAGSLNDGAVRLALTCAHNQAPSGVYTNLWLSSNSGSSWTQPTTDGAAIGTPASMTAVGNQSVILATSTGIYYLPLDGSQWQQAAIDGTAPANGFSYVGMTTYTQGVAIGDPAGTQIWMTTDGGQTWQPAPIQG
jgi:hypothetical protein